jgi:6-phosphogluconolactonase
LIVNAAPARWTEHADERALGDALSRELLAAIDAGRHAQGRALLLLSGGTTPVPVYRALGARISDWSEVTVGLVDERWVPESDAGSNARLLRETLFARVAQPPLVPLADLSAGLEGAVSQANARWATLAVPPCAVVLGMGDDGHTASLFPASHGLDAALASREPYAAIDATGCAGAGAWPLRISLTPAGWRQAMHRMLVIRGPRKRDVLDRALRERDARALPIAAALAGDIPLEIHWCP